MAKTKKATKKTKDITSVAAFLKWCSEIGSGGMLYRGLASVRWKVEASLYRRLIQKGMPAPQARSFFIHASDYLVEQAKQHGHARDYARNSAGELKPLQIMAQLQHYGASTCLIDFTRNPLVALWFACGQLGSKGKVVALSSDSINKYKIIQSKHLDDSLGNLLKKDHLWKWQPEKLNNRIVAQHSEFIFGEPVITPDTEVIVLAGAKKSILRELKEYNISEEHLLADFYGFAQLNAHNRPYNYALLATKAEEEGDHQGAIHLYDIAIKEKQGNQSTLLNSRGFVKTVAGNPQGAIGDFNKAIKLNKKYAEAYSNRGEAKYGLGKYESAIADHDQAINLNPQFATAYYNRGNAQDELGDYKSAIADYNQAIKFNPQYATAYNNRGIAKDKMRKHKSAIADYDRAIEINPQYASAYNNRGNAKGKSGDYKGAIVDYDQAIDIDSEYATVLLQPRQRQRTSWTTMRARLPTMTGRLNSIRNMRSPTTTAATPKTNWATRKARLPTMTGRLKSTRNMRKHTTTAASPKDNRATCPARLPTMTRRLKSTDNMRTHITTAVLPKKS